MNSTWEAAREVMEARAARAEWRRYQAAAARNEAMYQERMRARTAAPRVPVPPPVRVPVPKVQVETPNTRGKLAAYHINHIRYNAPSAASVPAPAHVPLQKALKNGNFNDKNKMHNELRSFNSPFGLAPMNGGNKKSRQVRRGKQSKRKSRKY
jgi:hypothetical protein